MALDDPKSLIEKLSDYNQVTFATWLQKTNIVAREEGDLNDLRADILDSLKQTIPNCSHPLDGSGNAILDRLTISVPNALKENFEIVAHNQKRTIVEIVDSTTIRVNAPFAPAVPDNSSVLNLSNINLVSAINHTQNDTRRTLIKAIAMS